MLIRTRDIIKVELGQFITAFKVENIFARFKICMLHFICILFDRELRFFEVVFSCKEKMTVSVEIFAGKSPPCFSDHTHIQDKNEDL